MKTCTKCSVEKPLTDFHSSKSKKSGKNSWCKVCAVNYSNQWRKNNLNRVKQHNIQFNLVNPEYGKQYINNRYKTDSMFKLIYSTRSLIGVSFKRSCKGTYKKGKKTEQILGCTVNEFIEYIKSLFQKGMTLENHGQGPGKWNIDHIIPISSAKTKDDVYKLNHYTNFQPLWWEENMKKFNH